ncbi:hypothetical protein GOBAR_DD32416 [Gossypium barbadense]|nr:hypothetical protein GOBAR_DD32416 [Gossypium barbadense]
MEDERLRNELEVVGDRDGILQSATHNGSSVFNKTYGPMMAEALEIINQCKNMETKMCAKNVQDPKWHPFKMINIRGNLQEILDEDDEKLKELRNEYGDVAFEAVSTALMEMNGYHVTGSYPVHEGWN